MADAGDMLRYVLDRVLKGGGSVDGVTIHTSKGGAKKSGDEASAPDEDAPVDEETEDEAVAPTNNEADAEDAKLKSEGATEQTRMQAYVKNKLRKAKTEDGSEISSKPADAKAPSAGSSSGAKASPGSTRGRQLAASAPEKPNFERRDIGGAKADTRDGISGKGRDKTDAPMRARKSR